jgi:hypothetical protein
MSNNHQASRRIIVSLTLVFDFPAEVDRHTFGQVERVNNTFPR